MKTVTLLAIVGLMVGCGAKNSDSSGSNVMASASATHLSSQTLTCRGKMTDDNGFPDGATTLTVTIANPNASTLLKLNRTDASRRIQLVYPTGYLIDIMGAQTQDKDVLISAFTASEFITVAIPVAALGTTGNVKGVSASFGSGGGTETAVYTCSSTVK